MIHCYNQAYSIRLGKFTNERLPFWMFERAYIHRMDDQIVIAEHKLIRLNKIESPPNLLDLFLKRPSYLYLAHMLVNKLKHWVSDGF